MAAFTLNGTRFIYNEGEKNISFDVTNNADKTYGGQVWINNTTQGDGVYMIPQPPFFKIGAKQKQIIRVINTDSSALPKNQESLFWLNVQEVPPKPENTSGGVLALAMNTQVKLIYRPTSIKKDRKNAEKKILVENKLNSTWIKNPTPYYMAITQIKSDGKDVNLSDKVSYEISQLKPFSEVDLGKKISGKISIDAINDWGGVQTYAIN